MKSEYFIAHRLYFSEQGKERMSRPAVKVALAGIILGIAIMLITIFVVLGFKQEVRNKVAGFGAHIQVTNFENNNTYEMHPIHVPDSMLLSLRSLEGVRSAHCFATKPGLIKTSNTFQGIVLKGVGDDYDWDFFTSNLVSGTIPSKPNEVLISTTLARTLSLDVDSAFLCYFIQDKARVRKYRITGLYNTQFSDHDNLFIMGSLAAVQKLNEWDDDQVSGIEILINDFSELADMYERVYFATANRFDEDGESYYTQSIDELNPAIFSWLALLDMNVVVIIILMLCVSGFNIISGLLILILDSIQLIGTLKALGATNRYIRRIFLIQASFLIGKGLFYGNLLGLGICILQYFFHLIPLDPSVYYVAYVPIAFHLGGWLALNLGTMLVSLLILLLPSFVITRISPAEVMRYE